MLTLSEIFFELIFSKFVSDVYGLMRRMLYLICTEYYCKFTMLLVKHCVVKNGPLYGVSYMYEV